MDKWLVRTEQNVISGPFPAEKVREMIASGKLGHQDEVCGAGVYWIYLHETDEIKKQLGVNVPRLKSGDDDEVTETDVIIANLAAHETREPHERHELHQDPDVQESDLPELSESLTENTAVLSNRAFRQFRSKKAQAAAMGTAGQASAGVAPPAQSAGHSETSLSAVSTGSISHSAPLVSAISREPMVAGESVEHPAAEPNERKQSLVFLLIFTALAVAGAYFVLRMRS